MTLKRWSYICTGAPSNKGTKQYKFGKPSVADVATFDPNNRRVEGELLARSLNFGILGYPQTSFDSPRNVLLRMIYLFDLLI
jgi:hypothetical protein